MARKKPHRRTAADVWRKLSPTAALAAIGVALGCDIPTELPVLTTQWLVPAAETRFDVDQLLPENGDVRPSSDGSAFDVDIDPVAFFQSLVGLCPACPGVDLTVPKPAFTGVAQSTADLPADVSAVTVLDGEAVLAVTNGLGFDPIRPATDVFGSLTLRVTDATDGDVLSQVLIDGADTPFDPGATLMYPLDLTPTVVNGSLLASVVLDSPAGDPVAPAPNAQLSVVATLMNVQVSSAEIDVSEREFVFDPVDLDVEDIDEDLEDGIIEGAFVLDVTNPFAVAADFDLTISGPNIVLQRSASIGSEPSSTVRLEFTGAELQSFLGEPGVVLSGSGVVDALAGVATLAPGQELEIAANMDLTVEIGGS